MTDIDMVFSSAFSKLKAQAVCIPSLKTWVLDLKEFFDKTILFENHHLP